MKTQYLKILTFIGLFSLAIGALATPLSGTYTVGPGETYTTILEAIQGVNSEGISANVIFNIKKGTYQGEHYFSNDNSNFTVTFQSQTGNYADVIVRNSGNVEVLDFYHSENVILKDLTIHQYNPYIAVRFSGYSKNIKFINCNFIGYSSSSSTTSFTLIYNTSDGNDEDLFFAGCIFDRASRAV